MGTDPLGLVVDQFVGGQVFYGRLIISRLI